MKKIVFLFMFFALGVASINVKAQSLDGPKNLYWVSFCGGEPVPLMAYDLTELQWVTATYDRLYWTNCDVIWI